MEIRQTTPATELCEMLGSLGLPQRRLAKILGSTPRHVRRWRRGERRVPHGIAVLLRLLVAGAIGVDQIEKAAAPAKASRTMVVPPDWRLRTMPCSRPLKSFGQSPKTDAGGPRVILPSLGSHLHVLVQPSSVNLIAKPTTTFHVCPALPGQRSWPSPVPGLRSPPLLSSSLPSWSSMLAWRPTCPRSSPLRLVLATKRSQWSWPAKCPRIRVQMAVERVSGDTGRRAPAP
jgi:hypothetical protein